ncbi:MAG TPA: hypothetical protein VFW62_10870 [bacterium]|nr:hypothetical protein [bacterium]
MIEFSANGQTLQVRVNTGLPTDRPTFTVERNCGAAIEAAALQRILSERLRAMVEEARRESYNEGYKDGRAKRGKRSWFHGRL